MPKTPWEDGPFQIENPEGRFTWEPAHCSTHSWQAVHSAHHSTPLLTT